MKKIVLLCLVVLIALTPKILPAGEVDDFRFATGLYRDQNYQLAKSELDKFIRLYPQSKFFEYAKFLLADVFLNENDYDSALELFEELYKEGSEPSLRPEVLLGAAQSCFSTNKLGRAKQLLQTFVKDFSKHHLLWKAENLLGRIEYQNENYQEALAHFDRAKTLSSDWTVVIHHLNTLLKLDRTDEAEAIVSKYIDEKVKNEYIYQIIVIFLNRQLQDKHYQKVISFAYEYIPQESLYYDDYLLVLSDAYIEEEKFSEALSNLTKMKRRSERSDYLIAVSSMRTGKEKEAERAFTELTRSAKNEEIQANSHFFLAELKGRTDKEETNKMLNQFIRNNPNHSFVGAANYKLGFNHFSQNKYGEAIDYFNKALAADLDEELKENGLFLTAESYFELQHTNQAIQLFNSYLNTYPKGTHTDEALFKSGLHYFRQADHPNAFVRFDRIINEFPDSKRAAMANFYHGEIFISRNQYDLAFAKYQAALENFEDRGLIWLRIAQVNFLLGKYEDAIEALNNVPDTETFKFEKETIKGNVLYAKKDYLKALESFDLAAKSAKEDVALEDAIIRQARSLYQLKEYREALSLYRKLLEINPKEQYLLMAGDVASTAGDYRAAISFYTRYLDEYQEAKEYFSTHLRLAGCYYNMKDYTNSAHYYQQLITPSMDKTILKNSLNGLEWSAAQSDDVDFEQEIKNAMTTEAPIAFQLLLQSKLVKYYYDNQRWDDVINMANSTIELSPDELENYDIEIMLAKAYIKIESYKEAEDIYRKLNEQKPDANVLFSWGELHLIQQDSLAALNKARQAGELTHESNVWLKVLKLGVDMKDKDFLIDYEQFLTFAKNVEKEQAQLLWIKWQLQNNNLDTANSLIENLLNSEYEPIKARAQFYKGVYLYKMGRISEAIPELLRVRYLYPRVEDVRLDAELLACYAYLDVNDIDNALKLYDGIKENLPQELKNKLKKELGLEG